MNRHKSSPAMREVRAAHHSTTVRAFFLTPLTFVLVGYLIRHGISISQELQVLIRRLAGLLMDWKGL